MSSVFRPVLLATDDNILLSLKNVESFGSPKSLEDVVVDKLKNDITIPVVMQSGKEYSISVRKQIDVFEKQGIPTDLEDAHSAILSRWIQLIG